VREFTKEHSRVWLVEIRRWETDPKRRIKAALDHAADRSDHKTFAGVEIYSYR
jgi:hypothetical protein